MMPFHLQDDDRVASATAGVGELAENRLRRSPYLALRDIGCADHEGAVTLRGRVPTYYLKQLAQEVVADVEGVHAVINRIEVLTPLSREGSRCES